MGAQDKSKIAANDRMAMMERKMAMIEGMMGRMGIMEKKISMMMEMMNGMMAQQEMMIK